MTESLPPDQDRANVEKLSLAELKRKIAHLTGEAVAGPQPQQSDDVPKQSLSDRLKIISQERAEAQRQQELRRAQDAQAQALMASERMQAESKRARELSLAKGEAISMAAELGQLLMAAGKEPDTPVISGYRSVQPGESNSGFWGPRRRKEQLVTEPVISNVWIVRLTKHRYDEPYYPPPMQHKEPKNTVGVDHKLTGGEMRLMESIYSPESSRLMYRTINWSQGFGLDSAGQLMKLIAGPYSSELKAIGLNDEFKNYVESSYFDPETAGTYTSLLTDIEDLAVRLLLPPAQPE